MTHDTTKRAPAQRLSRLLELHSEHPDCFCSPDLKEMTEVRNRLNWLLTEQHHRTPFHEDRHGPVLDGVFRSLTRLEKRWDEYQQKMRWEDELRCRLKYNPYHKPAGTPGGTGGEFDFAPGSGRGSGGSESGDGESGSTAPRAGDILTERVRNPKPLERIGTVASSGRNIPMPPSTQKRSQPYVPNDHSPPIPAYKKDFVKKDDWKRFNDHINNPKKSPDTGPVEKYAARQVFAAEGGMASPKDPRVTAVAGINKGYLKSLNVVAQQNDPKAVALLSRLGSAIDDPRTLTPEKVAEIYKYDFDKRFRGIGGRAALEKTGNPYAAAAMIDTVFRHGDKDGAIFLREAIVKTQPKMDLIISENPDYIGPEIFSSYSTLAKNPATVGNLLDNLAQSRERAAPKEKDRFEHFRFEKELEE